LDGPGLFLRDSCVSCRSQMNSIGIIGLGIIGRVWAQHYAAAGKLAGTWNRTPQPAAPGWMDSPEAVAASADVIQIVVADPAAVEGVLTRILPTLKAGKVILQSSTIDAESSAKFAKLVEARGARYLAALFTGSKPAAEQKQNVFYLGGDRALIAEIEPLLSLISSKRFVIGTNEQACTLKLAMNLNIAAQMQGLSEALTSARRAGIKLRTADYAPQFSVKHMHKDMRLLAHTAGCVDLPLLDTVRETLKTAEAEGMGDEDFSAMIKVLAQD
jgi:3-hydroxyisobutyrate dehydrogenase-like beta-hydroxyacid dehydrogenase